VKVATFTVRAVQQSVAWKRAAESEGFHLAGAWLAATADAYLKARARAGRPLPLYWRAGRFTVLLVDGCRVEVRSKVSPPFGHFQGTSYGPDTNKPRTLVCLTSGRVIATLRSAKQCRELAAELAPIFVRDEATASGIAERHQREAV
jgi:hypothetical protein